MAEKQLDGSTKDESTFNEMRAECNQIKVSVVSLLKKLFCNI